MGRDAAVARLPRDFVVASSLLGQRLPPLQVRYLRTASAARDVPSSPLASMESGGNAVGDAKSFTDFVNILKTDWTDSTAELLGLAGAPESLSVVGKGRLPAATSAASAIPVGTFGR